MAEYIDREAVKEIMKKHRCLDCTNEKSLDCLLCQLNIPFTEISKIPTADVVEVVRCKDCKHATFYSCKNDACYKGIICEYQIAIGDENFFCACGEARTPKERDMEK